VRTEIVCHQLPCQTERNNLELYRWFVPRVITLAIIGSVHYRDSGIR
jgi:hypothetical protein